MGYWDKRQAKIMYEQMEEAEKAAKQIADIYAKSTRELNFQIEKIFGRFTDRHNLSEQEARKLLGMMKNPSDIAQLKQALANDPKNKALLAELESPAYRARIERLENLQTEIDRMMKNVYMQEKTIVSAHYANVFSNSYYQGIYNIQGMAGFQFSFSAVDPEMLDRMLSMEWSGANYSSRIWNNTTALAKELKEQLILSYLTGKRSSEIANEIANKFGVSAYKARRLVRTESCFQANMGQLAAYEEADIEKYMIVATLDLRTSPVCRQMDGKIFERTKASIGSNMPPFHPFCRSTTVAVFDDEDLHRLKRRARDPVTGESKLIPADTNYQKWYQQNVANNPEALAADKMVRNGRKSQKKLADSDTQITDFVIRNNNNARNTTSERIKIMSAIAKMPKSVQNAIQQGITIDVGKIGASQYDYINDIMYIAKNAGEDDIIHEIGHMVENKMLDKDKVSTLRKKIIGSPNAKDISLEIFHDANGNPVEVFLLKNKKFISEYQGRVYVDNVLEAFDNNGNFKDELLWEFVSEPFREFITNPAILKSKSPELYDLIAEAVK